jgi:glycosyltransferase involved in cell wall biosynthesis
MNNFLWSENGACRKSEGYGVASTNIVNGLKNHGIDIDIDLIPIPDELQNLSNFKIGYFNQSVVNSNVIINHSLPDVYRKAKKYSIGFSYWETTRLPSHWIKYMNDMDEIWTTSSWAKKIFKESGVQSKIYDFKLGVDPKLYYPKFRERKEVFTFLSIGSPSSRKNSQIAVNAFISLFGKEQNINLIYKSNGPPDARLLRPHGGKDPLSSHPRIRLIDYEVSDSELAKIYDEADCLLYPTSGEGWGLLPMQAIAKGIPTICTNATACTEFANFSLPLDFEWSSDKMLGIYQGAGEWAIPNYDDLCDKMLYVVNNYHEIAKHTFNGAKYIAQNFTWDKVTKTMANRLCQI